MPRTYTREEADEILRRALSGGQAATDGISHDDLVAAAREVGIPESAIAAAANQLGEHALVKQRVELIRGRKRRGFIRHLVVFLLVAGLAFLAAGAGPTFIAPGGLDFLKVPMLIWAMLLVMLGFWQLAPNREKLEKKAERELEKERRRDERKRRIAGRTGTPRGAPQAAKEFEAAVQEGVSVLLTGAARAIRGFTPEAGRFRVDKPEEDSDDSPRPSERSRQRQRR